jgi:hypothetical protein
MNIEDKQKIIQERISQIDFHISLLMSSIEEGYSNKDKMATFEEVLTDFTSKKEALQNYLSSLE